MDNSVGIQVSSENPSVEPETNNAEGSNSEVSRPEGLPENFKDVSSLAESYKQLQAEHTKLKQNTASSEEPKTEEQPKENQESQEEKPEDQSEAAEELLDSKGLDMQSFSDEFAEKGELSENSYDSLAKAGIPKEMVDAYIAGQEAIALQQTRAIYETTGGEENYNAMIKWAADNLSEPEKIAFNDSLSASNSIEQTKLAVQGLHAKFTAAEGSNPKFQNTQSGNSASGDVFKTSAEMSLAGQARDAQGRKKIDTDPAYRQWYFETIERSPL